MLKSQILLQHVATMPLLIQLRNISLLSLVGFPLRCALKTNQKTILAGHVGGLSATPAGPSPSCHGLRIVHDLGQRRTCCAAPRLWGERRGQLQASASLCKPLACTVAPIACWFAYDSASLTTQCICAIWFIFPHFSTCLWLQIGIVHV